MSSSYVRISIDLFHTEVITKLNYMSLIKLYEFYLQSCFNNRVIF